VNQGETAPPEPTTPPSRFESFTPKLISQLREGYGLRDFRADAIAGVTVAIVALPLSMAIAIASGLPPERGLYTAIVGGFLISLLGGSRFQIGGPAGAFIVLIAAIVGRHGYDGLVLATFMAGVMLMLIGALRLGGLIRLIPQPVLVGFTAGIAVIIFASQIRELLGLDIAQEPAALLPKLAAIGQAIGTARPLTIAIAVLGLAIILVQRRYRPTWPGMLFAVAITAVLTGLLHLDVATIGTRFGGVPSSLPNPALPDFSLDRMIKVLPDALAITLLGAIESLLSAVVADGMTGRRHRSNGELVAQGIGNMVAVIFGGMPVTGTIARTATNIRAGATGPVSGMLHAIYLLAFMLIAAPLAYHVPLAALGAVLAVVCWNMAEKHEFWHFLTCGWRTAVVLVATFGLTVFVDLIAGIAVGTLLGLVIARMAPDTPVLPIKP
jgi:sulfate permease, SulP family